MEWSSAFLFLISHPPLSEDDRLLWLSLLRLLRRLLESECVNPDDLLLTAGKLAGGSALEWLQTASGAVVDDSATNYQLAEVRSAWTALEALQIAILLPGIWLPYS